MKKLFTLLFCAIVSLAKSQAPQKISYQGIARNITGQVVSNQPIGVKFDIRQGSPAGSIVFTETHALTTNAFGLFTTAIGSANPSIFATINWGTGTYFLEVSIDPAGGTAYTSVGNQQLMSVPYALYAEKAGNSTPTPTISINAPNTVSNPSTGIYNINVPVSSQSLSVSSNSLSISNGNTVVLPTGITYTAGTGIDLTGNVITNTAPNQTVNVTGANVTGTYPNYTVNSQTLSISGNTLDISNGNSVVLPSGTTYSAGTGIDLTGNVITNTAPNQTVNVSGANVVGSYPNYTINSTPAQTLSITGNTLDISNGNAVVLPTGTTYSAGTGIDLTGNVITNTNPDQVVSLFGIGGATVTGTYPNYTVNVPAGTSLPTGYNGQIMFYNGTVWDTIPQLGLFYDAVNNRVGVGTDAPISDFHVNGAGRFNSSVTTPQIYTNAIHIAVGTFTNSGDVLTNDGAGNGVWQTPATYSLTQSGSNIDLLKDGASVATVTLAPGTSYVAGTGISVNSGTITNTAPNQTVNISGAGVVGSYPNYTITPSTSTSLVSANSNIQLLPGANSYTLNAYTYSLTNNSNTLTLTNGAPLGYTSTVVVPVTPSTSLVQGSNVSLINSGNTYTVSSITPTLSVIGGTLSGAYPAQTLTIPASSLTTITGSINISVLGTAPNYTLSSPNQSLTLIGNSLSITGANTVVIPTSTVVAGNANISVTPSGNTYSVSAVTPTLSVVGGTLSGTYPTQTLSISNNSTTLVQGNNVSLTNAGNTYTVSAITPTLSVIGGTLTGTYPIQTLSIPTASTTTVAQGANISVTGSAPNFTVSAPNYVLGTSSNSITLTNGVSSSSVAVPIQTLALSGSTLTSGPITNSVNLSGLNGIYGGSGAIQTGSTTVSISTNTLTFSSGTTTNKPIVNFYGGGVTGTHLAIGHLSANPANIKFLGSVATAPVDYGYVSASSSGMSISGGTSSNGLFVTNSAEVGAGTVVSGIGKFVVTSAATSTAPTAHFRETGVSQLVRLKFSNTNIAGKFFEVASDNNGVDNNAAFSINYHNGTNYRPVFLITGDYKAVVHNMNTPLASLHVMDTTNNGGGIASEGFNRPGVLVLARNNQPGFGARLAVSAGDELGRLSFSGHDGGSYGGGPKIYARAMEAFTGSGNGSELIFTTIPIGTTSQLEVLKLLSNGNVVVNPMQVPNAILHVRGSERLDSSLTMSAYNSPPFQSAPNEGRIYFDRPSNKFKVSENGGAYVDLVGGAGASPWIQGAGIITQNNLGDYVGIGTAAPTSQLHVYGMSDPLQMTVENSGGAFKTGYNIKTALQEWFIGKDQGAQHGLHFTDITNGQVRMAIETSGNVGIGTASPNAFLDVENNDLADGIQLNMNNASNGSNGLQVTHFGTGSAGYFNINNTGSNGTALAASSNGTGRVIEATQNGTGYAGHFFINNASNSTNVIYAKTIGAGAVIMADNTGTGRAIEAKNYAGNNQAVIFAQSGGTGTAGFFEVINTAANNNAITAASYGLGSTIFANNLGTAGHAGYFNIPGGSTNPDAALLATNIASGTALDAQAGLGKAINATNSSSLNPTIYSNNAGSADGIQSFAAQGRALYVQNNGAGSAAIEANNAGTGTSLLVYKNGSTTLGSVASFANNSSSNASDAVIISNSGVGDGLYVTKPAGVTGGNVIRVENLSTSNAADAVYVLNNGAGAAIHAITGPTVTGGSNTSLWLESGHLKSTQAGTLAAITVTNTGSFSGSTYSFSNATDVKGTLLAVTTTTSGLSVFSGSTITMRVTFAKAYSVAPTVVITPIQDMVGLSHFVTNVTPNSFNITIKNSTAATINVSSLSFGFNYMVIE